MYAHFGLRHKKKVKELEQKLKEMELAGNVSSSLSTTHTVLKDVRAKSLKKYVSKHNIECNVIGYVNIYLNTCSATILM